MHSNSSKSKELKKNFKNTLHIKTIYVRICLEIFLKLNGHKVLSCSGFHCLLVCKFFKIDSYGPCDFVLLSRTSRDIHYNNKIEIVNSKLMISA